MIIHARLREDTLYEESPTATAPTSAGDLRFRDPNVSVFSLYIPLACWEKGTKGEGGKGVDRCVL